MIVFCSTQYVTCFEQSIFQASRHGVSLSPVNNLKNQNHQAHSVADESLMPFVIDTTNLHR